MAESSSVDNSTQDSEASNSDGRVGESSCQHGCIMNSNGPLLMSQCEPLWHQVAGHFYNSSKINGGMWKHSSGVVLKGVQKPPKGPRERNFYRDVFSDRRTNTLLLQLRLFLPLFYGIYTFPNEPVDEYIAMEDLAQGFRKPCILDVKIGAQTYDPLAPPEKIKYELLKWPPIVRVGFLLIGMRVFQPSTHSYITLDKNFGRSLTEETIAEGLARFFTQDSTLLKDVIISVLKNVDSISNWFLVQKSFHFYASSLLIMYDGLPASEPADPTPLTLPNPKPLQSDQQCVQFNGVYDEKTIDKKGVNLPDNKSYLSSCVGDNSKPTRTYNNKQDTISSTDFIGLLPRDGSELQVPGGSRGGIEIKAPRTTLVKMIDFTHVFQSKTHDGNYLFGLDKLRQYLNEIRYEKS